MHRLAYPCVIVALALVTVGCRSKSPPRRAATAPISLDEGNLPADPAVLSLLAEQDLAEAVTLIQFGLADSTSSNTMLDEMAALKRTSAIQGLCYLRVDVSRDAAAAKAYCEGKDLPFGVVYDGDRSVARAFGVRVVPCVALIGKFGRIRYRGPFPTGTLDEWAEALVAEAVDPGSRVPKFGAPELNGARLLVSTRLPSLDKPAAPLSRHFGANGLVIVFVDTTCPYAGTAISDLPSVAASLGMLDVPTVAVNLDDPADDVRAYFADKSLGVPLLFDTTTGTKLRWKITSVPTVLYVDAEAEIGYNGPAVWGDLGVAVIGGVQASQGISFSTPGTSYG